MPKTLEDAIGCWTVNPEYNSLPRLAKGIVESAKWCKSATLSKKNDPTRLLKELLLLRGRIEVMLDLTNSAISRCQQIIETGEVDK